MQSGIASLAAILTIFNISPVFAAAGDIPAADGLFQVLTVRSFHQSGEDISYDVDVPGIISGDRYTEEINAGIQSLVDEKLAEGAQIVKEFKTAFFETGGTQEQWDARDNRVSVTYTVKFQTNTTVSFVIDYILAAATVHQEEFFYNLDLKNHRELTLLDLLGSGWMSICNESIRRQIAGYPLSPGDRSPFFRSDRDSFRTVNGNTGFYINGEGNPVVVFPRATIAIGAMGIVEFEITG